MEKLLCPSMMCANFASLQKEIEDLTQKGFSKEEIIQSHQYDNEIKKGSNFIAWIVDLITWFLP